MPRPTTASALRQYKAEYYRLMAHEARLNRELHNAKQRIKKIAEDEAKWMATKVQLSEQLMRLTQIQTDIQSQFMPEKQRHSKLQKVEKQLLEVKKKYARTEYHLSVLEERKFKDNVATLVLREHTRDQVTLRAQAALATWQKFEQILQCESVDVPIFSAQPTPKANQEHTYRIPLADTPFPGKAPSFVAVILRTRPDFQVNLHTCAPGSGQNTIFSGQHRLCRPCGASVPENHRSFDNAKVIQKYSTDKLSYFPVL